MCVCIFHCSVLPARRSGPARIYQQGTGQVRGYGIWACRNAQHQARPSKPGSSRPAHGPASQLLPCQRRWWLQTQQHCIRSWCGREDPEGEPTAAVPGRALRTLKLPMTTMLGKGLSSATLLCCVRWNPLDVSTTRSVTGRTSVPEVCFREIPQEWKREHAHLGYQR